MSNIVQGNFNITDKLDITEDGLIDLLTDKVAPEDSSAYAMVQVVYTPDELEKKDDLLNGGKRNRKWGAQVSVGIVPNIDKIPTGNITLAQAPAIFVDADSLSTLRERIIYEVDKALTIARVSQENPTLMRKVSEKVMSEISAAMQTEK